MTVNEAIILWNQPHNRQVAVSTARADAELLAALKAELQEVAAVDDARTQGQNTGCAITKARRQMLADLIAAATPKEQA